MARDKKRHAKKVKAVPVRQVPSVRPPKQLQQAHPGGPPARVATGVPVGSREVTQDPRLDRLTPEQRAKLEARERMLKEVLEFVREHPEEATRLIRAWAAREESE
jgi:flagellar biosynthesis/type III secretory pathway M-ring protein FliF/YscJ